VEKLTKAFNFHKLFIIILIFLIESMSLRTKFFNSKEHCRIYVVV